MTTFATSDTGAEALLGPAEAAAVLGVSEAWLRRQAASRLVPCVRLGRQLRFTREQVEQIIAGAAQPVAIQPTFGLTRRSRRPA